MACCLPEPGGAQTNSARMGVSLLLQKRLAASVLKCGKRKVWLDPNEINEISMANSRAPLSPSPLLRRETLPSVEQRPSVRRRVLCCAAGQNIRKLVKDGFVIQKPQKVHSRARTNAWAEAKRKASPIRSPMPRGRGGGRAAGRRVDGKRASANREAAAPSARRRDATLATANGRAPRRRACRSRCSGSGGCACCAGS